MRLLAFLASQAAEYKYGCGGALLKLRLIGVEFCQKAEWYYVAINYANGSSALPANLKKEVPNFFCNIFSFLIIGTRMEKDSMCV